ncbi:hypothetical protein R3P38DRAFT_2665536 [Favolaschia claudopus]|uniref:Uncharacterized protein n=1 Tax=Favolaschia claudopus TaxID=2862362 RepID=A0AAV9ZCR9_9AGAR
MRSRLPDSIAKSFKSICSVDATQLEVRRRTAQNSQNAVRQDDSCSASGSLDALPRPGQIYAPSRIKAHLRLDVSSLRHVLSARLCLEDVLKVKRFRAKCSRPYWEYTTRWMQAQASTPFHDLPQDHHIYDLYDPTLVELSSTLHRSPSPEQDKHQLTDVICDYGDYTVYTESAGSIDPSRQPENHFVATEYVSQPRLLPDALQIIYLDVYGTPIDNETGIFTALQPLLAGSTYRFERHEALSHYFELESEAKTRFPTMPYFNILAHTYAELALRLGHGCTPAESATFAVSSFHWPLFPGAIECLAFLRTRVPHLVALLDMDFTMFSHTAHFTVLVPYFSAAYTHDTIACYRPHRLGNKTLFVYHDAQGIARRQRAVVSGSMFRDVQPAIHAHVPCIWMRFPASLSVRLPSVYSLLPWKVGESLEELVEIVSVQQDGEARHVDRRAEDIVEQFNSSLGFT